MDEIVVFRELDVVPEGAAETAASDVIWFWEIVW